MAYTIYMFIYCAVGFLGGILAEKLQPRVAIYIGLVLFAGGWILTGFALSLIHIYNQKELLQDIAALTGSTFINKDISMELKDVTLDQLGTIKKVIVTKDHTTMIAGNKDVYKRQVIVFIHFFTVLLLINKASISFSSKNSCILFILFAIFNPPTNKGKSKLAY